MRQRPAILLCLASLQLSSCAKSDTTPTPLNTMVITQEPLVGSTIVVPEGTPPGAFFVRGTNQFPVTVVFSSGTEQPFARLSVYLMTGDGACGQNLPDSPTWSPFPKGQSFTYTVTGFQVYRLPCDVTAIRAVLQTRTDTHNNAPPTTGEIVADATKAATYRLVPPQ